MHHHSIQDIFATIAQSTVGKQDKLEGQRFIIFSVSFTPAIACCIPIHLIVNAWLM